MISDYRKLEERAPLETAFEFELLKLKVRALCEIADALNSLTALKDILEAAMGAP